VRSFPEPGKGIKDCNAIGGGRPGGAGRDDIHNIIHDRYNNSYLRI